MVGWLGEAGVGWVEIGIGRDREGWERGERRGLSEGIGMEETKDFFLFIGDLERKWKARGIEEIGIF